MLPHLLHWLYLNVWGNIVASALWSAGVVLAVRLLAWRRVKAFTTEMREHRQEMRAQRAAAAQQHVRAMRMHQELIKELRKRGDGDA